eukprot:11902369-Prorocentrum_lima.AAC.1
MKNPVREFCALQPPEALGLVRGTCAGALHWQTGRQPGPGLSWQRSSSYSANPTSETYLSTDR